MKPRGPQGPVLCPTRNGNGRKREADGATRTILVVERMGGFAAFVHDVLSPGDYRVHARRSVDDAVTWLRETSADVVLVDVCTTDGGLLGGVESVMRAPGSGSTVIVTGCPLMSMAARMVYPGADAVLQKPCTPAELRRQVSRAHAPSKVAVADGRPFHGIVGSSTEIQRVIEQIRTVAPTDCTVLISGETGTGKELVARAIHRCSARADGPYVVVDALAVSEGLLESELFGHERGAFTGAVKSRPGLFQAAQGGTIFLDEMGDVSPAVQARLLRAIQEREVRPVGAVRPRSVDVRIVAASQRDPEELVESGALRADLFYRLSVFDIRVPPLREHRTDVPALVDHYLRSRASTGEEVVETTELTERMLTAYDWPGNVRELLAVVEAAAVRARDGRLRAWTLPHRLHEAWRRRAMSENGVGRAELIGRALEETDGGKVEAAELLGVSRTTLWRWMNE